MASTELLRMVWTQIWQLTLLVVAILLLVRWFGRTRPHLAHVLWLVVLVKCVTPPLWTSPSGVFCWLQRSIAPVAETVLEARKPAPLIAIELDGAERFSKATPEQLPLDFPTVESTAPNKSTKYSLSTKSNSLGWQVLMATWLGGASAILVLAAIRWWSCWRTICRAEVESREDLKTLLGNLAFRLQIRKRVRLMVTASRIGPAVVGVWRPMILLPAAVVHNKTARELEPILAHELMHVRRGDLWIGMWQVLAQSVWWFHPLVWLANRFLSRDAERCCDEEVIAELGCDPARYARSLLDVLELKRTLIPVPVFPGVRPVEVTSRRLERIMQLGQGCHKRTPWWCWLVMVLVAAIAIPGAAFVAAGDKNKPTRQSREVRGSDSERTSPDSNDVIGEPLLSRSYPVRDVLARIQGDLQQDQSDAKHTLELLLLNMGASEPEQQVSWSGRKLLVRNTAHGHERIENTIQFVRDNGIQQVLIEVHMISGAPEVIDKLHSNWELLDVQIPVGEVPGGSNRLPPGPLAARSPTDFAVRQASVAETTEKRQPALCAVVDAADATAILDQVRANSKLMTITAPKVTTFTGQTATVQSTSQRPFVVGFKMSADRQPEPQQRIVSSGLGIHLLPLPHDNDQVRLNCQLELSSIRSVEEKKLTFGPNREQLTIQVPEVVATKIHLAYDLPLGRTLLIGGLLNTTHEGKSLATLVMLRCTKFDKSAQPSVSQASSTTAEPPAPAGAYSRIPDLSQPPVVFPNPERAAAAQAVHTSSTDSWVERLRSFGVSLQLAHPIPIGAANEKLELSAGRLQITFGDPHGSVVLESDKGVFFPPTDVSKTLEPLTAELSGNVRLHSPGGMQASAERIRVQINGESCVSAVQMFQTVTLIGNEFSAQADEVSISEGLKIRFLGKVELNLKSDDGKPNEQTIRAEQIEWDMRAGVIRADGAVISYLGNQRAPHGKAQRNTFTKTYYVADLVVPIPNSATVVVNPSDATQAAQANLTSNARPTLADFKTITDLITQTINPESWSKSGGSGAIESFPTNLSLVISQTGDVHQQIADFLKELRKLQDNQVSLEARVVGLSADILQGVGADVEKKTNSTSPHSATVHCASRATPRLLNAIQNDPSAKIMALPKMTLFNGQTAVLQVGFEGARLDITLRPVVSADRRSLTIGSSVGNSADNLRESTDEQTAVTLVSGDTMLIDLAQSLRPEALGWSASREVSMLDKIPYLEWLFKSPSDSHIERMYLLITPRIIIQEEEEEQKLGIDVSP